MELGDRLVVVLAGLVAGGVLSPPDQSRVRKWPYAFQHLAALGEGAFVEPCRRLAAEAAGRGTPPKTARYFEGRLGDLDAEMVDSRSVAPGRSHVNGGLTSLVDVLGAVSTHPGTATLPSATETR